MTVAVLLIFLAMGGIPLLDQRVKHLVRLRCADSGISLGLLGSVQAVQGRMWMARAPHAPGPMALWVMWSISAAALMAASLLLLPQAALFAGLLLGGSLSHLLEHTSRGCITDYICLRFWPAFNLADAAITLGALGLLWRAWGLVAGASPAQQP